MSPGEFARRGAGLTIRWGWFDSPFGPRPGHGDRERGLCGLRLHSEVGRDERDAGYGRVARCAIRRAPGDGPVGAAAFSGRGEAAFHDRRAVPDQGLGSLDADPVGACDHLFRYRARPSAIRSAVRAVGTAVGRNPVSFLIPCHRALRKSGGLGRLSLGPAGQTGHSGVGIRPRRRLTAVRGIKPISPGQKAFVRVWYGVFVRV